MDASRSMNTRSRTGCAACLKQHKKCDEKQPTCGRCARLNVRCEYGRELRWFNGTQLPRARPRARRSAKQQILSWDHYSLDLVLDEQTDSPNANISADGHRNRNGESLALTDQSDVPLSVDEGIVEITPDQHLREIDFGALAHNTSLSFGYDLACVSDSPLPVSTTPRGSCFGSEDGHIESYRSPSLPMSPREMPLVESYWVPEALFDSAMNAMLFQDTGRHMAYSYFLRSVSLILPAQGGLRNAYGHMATFALSSPMFLDTVISVATIYMHLRGIVPRSIALDRQSRALASLRNSVDILETANEPAGDATARKREALAAVLLQITIEIANGTGGIRSHINYAMKLFRELGYDSAVPSSALSLSLVQRLTYIDVLSSILWQGRPLLPLSFWFFNQNYETAHEMAPSVVETTGCPLWTLATLARISHLMIDLKEGSPRDIILPKAQRLEGDLILNAQSHLGGYPPSNQDASFLDTVALCYYWSAFILLQRRVFGDAHNSLRVQQCLESLITLLKSLPVGCGPDTALSLPLYVAALVATRPEHRAFLKDRNRRLAQQYPMETRTALTDAFESIWAATDQMTGSGSSSTTVESADPTKAKALFIC